MRLLVEFPRGCPLEEWHLHPLRTATHVLTLTQEVSHMYRPASVVAGDRHAGDWDRF
jgi:hypothetical protein